MWIKMKLFERTFLIILPLVVLLSILNEIRAQVLTPPYFNLVQGRRIEATATCGEGVPEPELYCKLVGSDTEKQTNYNQFIIQGQFCDHCDPNNPDKKHPAEYAVDGRDTRWQSPPLSRGIRYQEVNLTIELGQEFHVAYVILKMGNSPRPGVWVLERSIDNGQTFQPWQYFARNKEECQHFFGDKVESSITSDDSVICNTQYTKVTPLEEGEVAVPLVQDRPSANDFFNSTVLQEWTRATNVRIRLLRVNNLFADLMPLADQDTSTTRRYFYSIKDISIGGRCRCNGHADTCTSQVPDDPYHLVCDCKDQTCGNNCEVCCPGFEQKKWSQSKNNRKFVCEPCNCFGHSTQCTYNETVDALNLSLDIHGKYDGGGVCQNCQHNTEGINCNKCARGYYRPKGKTFDDSDVCKKCVCDLTYSTGNCEDETGKCECKPEFTKPNCDSCSFGFYGYPLCRPCECYINGTTDRTCEPTNGICSCKRNFGGQYCRFCAEGFYNYPECIQCECHEKGSISNVCDITSGQCKCVNSFGGKNCNQCSDGYFNFPQCAYCNCDVKGTLPEICDKINGQCLCKPGYGGPRCDQCIASYTGFPDCKSCNCSTVGSVLAVCDIAGKCTCHPNFGGKRCNQCSPGFYQYPDCKACNCDPAGTYGASCNNDGTCICQENFSGQKCNECKNGYYNYPKCQECNYNPSGVVSTFTGCNTLKPGELINCKGNVEGNQCNECKDRFWNLQATNPLGCEECVCNLNGTIDGLSSCNAKTGQCHCKFSVTGKQCDQCSDGYYHLAGENYFGCTDCDCDIGGATRSICNKYSGQCDCLPRVTGRNCNKPLALHYFPTLHQYQFEIEDGYTSVPNPNGNPNPVRYGFEDEIFPGYSWKGYAVFSSLQNEINQNIFLDKPSVYRIILRYINPNSFHVSGTISVVPEFTSNHNEEQKFQVLLKPTSSPNFVTVAGISGKNPSPFVLTAGTWIVKIKIEKSFFLDYFVLIPAEYYEASLLISNVTQPCTIDKGDICRHYMYPNVSTFGSVRASGGYIKNDDNRSPIQLYFSDYQSSGASGIVLLSPQQPSFHMDMPISRPGKYVFVIIYASARNQNSTFIEVTIRTQKSKNEGIFNIYNCRYTSLCRQVLLQKNGAVATFEIDSNFVSVTLTSFGFSGDGIGIDSIIAIPVEQWSLGYIQPASVCLKKDNTCIVANYSTPADAKKIDFKSGNEDHVTKTLPSTILDDTVELILLNSSNNMINLKGKVPKAGLYTFVVHYYQPNHPAFEVDIIIIQNEISYEAKLPVQHCPSNSGCRSAVKQANGNSVFSLPENFVLSIKDPNKKDLWLHYLLAIPSNQYNDKVTSEMPFDQTAMFISLCGTDGFSLETSKNDFCRNATFSLTTKYNYGTLSCSCDFQGSLSYECAAFGGQCKCLPNIIGRRCDSCKTKYFGFPNCKLCSCPSQALCDHITGECTCPPNVLGEKCDKCQPYTYGLHPIHGCYNCSCNNEGVRFNNMQCNLETGACDCKENIEGRTCDHCVAGHWRFPNCFPCECDLRGTTMDICNQENAECFCKPNVHGAACDVCKDGTFNLQPDNEEGCTKCFCFGKTSRCSSSTLFIRSIPAPEGWKLAIVNAGKYVEVTNLSSSVENIDGGIEVNLGFIVDRGITYFVAPQQFLGNKLSSYGNTLNYTLFYSASADGAPVAGSDVILYGAGMYLFFESVDAPPANSDFSNFVRLVETNFLTQSGSTVTREELMQVLRNLSAIYIKATFSSTPQVTKLLNVALEVGVPIYTPNADRALAVEQCHCPPNYVGLSCEECADGYYRVSTGPFGGNCFPCQCNGHADSCDKATGICNNCKHNTKGDHCEKCEIGYYGNATFGSPTDCLICPCPLLIPSNNFATGCDIVDQGDRITCNCKPGYTGDRCEMCAPGFHGQPEVAGELCVPCQCNGNANLLEPGSCDPITGRCLKCLHNTSGDSCDRCAPGFFGDAINARNCQPCNCDTCGTKECNHKTGSCICQTNVVGEKCDRCAINHFGFTNCQGCFPCHCETASESQQCDDLTGHCRCKPGVTGQICDRCMPGFWKYTPEGCTSCGCNTEYSVGVGCNVKTGMCECLPGVIGDKCNECPHRWVLIPDQGCFGCDKCIDGLLDVTDVMNAEFTPLFNQFQTASIAYFTVQRLKFINETADNYAVNVSDIVSHQFDLLPFNRNISEVQNEVENAFRNAKQIYSDTLKAAKMCDLTHKTANEVEFEIVKVIEALRIIVKDVTGFGYSLEVGAVRQVDYSLKNAQNILSDINNMDIDEEKEREIKDALEKANSTAQSMIKFAEPLGLIRKQVDLLTNKYKMIDHKIDELDDFSDNAKKFAIETTGLNQINKKAKIHDKLTNINDISNDIQNTINDLSDFSKNASEFTQMAQEDLKRLVERKNVLSGKKSQTNQDMISLRMELEKVREQSKQAQQHAEDLKRQANILESSAKMPLKTDVAVNAANSYKDISTNLKAALMNITNANGNAEQANLKSTGIQDRLLSAQNISVSKRDEAYKALETVQHTLSQELNSAIQFLNSSSKSLNQTEVNLRNTKEQLNTIQGQQSSMENLRNFQPDDIIKKSQEVMSKANSINVKLPEKTMKSKKLINDLNDKKRDIQEVDSYLSQFNEKLPSVKQHIDILTNTPLSQNETLKSLATDLDALKKKVLRARDITSKIKVGVKLSSQTSLELPIPESLLDQGSSTDISLFFKTNQPNSLLFYLGNEDPRTRIKRDTIRRPKFDDFLALLLVNGYPQLKLSLGEKPVAWIVINKTVNLNQWNGISIQRTNKIINLTLTDSSERKYTSKGESSGLHFTLNLDKEQSKFYIGGIPISFEAPRDIEYTSFTGEFQDLSINGEPIGFWNFADISIPNGYQIRDVIDGSSERNELGKQTQPTSSRFSGDGYVKIKVGNYLSQTENSISLSFKTTALNGLLFFCSNSKEYIAIQISSGFIFFIFDMGKGGVLLRSPFTYSDGNWHRIIAKRFGNNGLLTVDDKSIPEEENKPQQEASFNLPEFLYLAGFDGDHMLSQVSKIPFDGCLDKIQIGQQSVVIDNVNSFKAMPGCPVKISNIVAFEEDKRGFVSWPGLRSFLSPSSHYNLELALRFKTKGNWGLIAFGTDGTNKFSLQISNNTLIFKSGSQQVQSNTNIKLNDDRWHSVMAVNEPNALHLLIDDNDISKSNGPQRSTPFSPSGRIYFGTVPAKVDSNVAIDRPFVGCIADVTVNNVQVNFENVWEANAAIIGQCSGPAKSVNAPSIDSFNESQSPTSRPSVTSSPVPALPIPKAPGSLPLVPAVDPDLNEESGIRFGTSKQSSLMYDFDPTTFEKGLSIQMDVKTVKSDAIIFYVSHLEANDFVSLYLRESNFKLKYYCGGISNTLSQPMVTQAEWYKVNFEITSSGAKLRINGREESDDTGCNSISLVSPYYVGGFDNRNILNKVQEKLGFNETFVGCLKNFKSNQHYLKEPRHLGTIPCSDKVEEGTFFSLDSYIKIYDNFKVGIEVEIKLTFKPRVLDALLVAVHSKKDFLVLQMINGTIKFTVDNGNGQISNSYSPQSTNYFLDNAFHTISAYKHKNVIMLTVDSNSSPPTLDYGTSTTTDTNHPLYIGGYPPSLTGSRGIETTSNFVGCISKLEINERAITLASLTTYGTHEMKGRGEYLLDKVVLIPNSNDFIVPIQVNLKN